MFGPYTLDLRSGELRKHGTRLKLGEQPLQILLLMLERPGGVVTREELRERLWASDTFVDFDHGLNSAVQRLRDCLSDSAGQARWIETVPRRGYRFVGEVEWKEEAPAPEAPALTNGRGATAEVAATSDRRAPRLGTRRWLVVTAALAVVAAASLWVYQKRTSASVKQTPAIRSMAVLPLENLSADPQQDYFADGMTDELITMLAKNASLRVISRTTVMQYKGVHRPLRDIARELGVDGVVEGSVVRTGGKVRVTAQLIHAASDTHLWAESYERDVRDVIALQKEVAEAIAARVNTNSAPSRALARTISPEAHDAYLRGRYFWFSGPGFEKSREYFEKAVRLQPDYADAWSGLGDYYGVHAVDGDIDPLVGFPKYEEFVRKALSLDDSSAQAHLSMAAIHLFFKWDWAAADEEARRAIELDPNFAEAHHLRCYILEAMGRIDESLIEAQKAIELDPRARPRGLGNALIMARRYDAAVKELTERSEAYPDRAGILETLSYAHFLSGHEREWIEGWARSLELEGKPRDAATLRRIYRERGSKAVLEWDRKETMKDMTRSDFSLRVAAACADVGDREQTLYYLERAYEHRASELIWIHLKPRYDFLHSDPRYLALLKKIGLALPPATQASLH